MITFDSNYNVLIGLDPIDFRCGINRLAAIAQAEFKKDPRGQFIFVFRNKRKTDIKLIGYNENGFFMGHKRLSKGKLSWWPRTERECLSVDSEKLLKLLRGVDPRGSFHPDWNGSQDSGEQGQSYTDFHESRDARAERAHQEEQPQW